MTANWSYCVQCGQFTIIVRKDTCNACIFTADTDDEYEAPLLPAPPQGAPPAPQDRHHLEGPPGAATMMYAIHCRMLGCIFTADTDDEYEARRIKHLHESRNAAINNVDRHHRVSIQELVSPKDPEYDILREPREVWAA